MARLPIPIQCNLRVCQQAHHEAYCHLHRLPPIALAPHLHPLPPLGSAGVPQEGEVSAYQGSLGVVHAPNAAHHTQVPHSAGMHGLQPNSLRQKIPFLAIC